MVFVYELVSKLRYDQEYSYILPHPYICLMLIDILTVYVMRKSPYTDHFMQFNATYEATANPICGLSAARELGDTFQFSKYLPEVLATLPSIS